MLSSDDRHEGLHYLSALSELRGRVRPVRIAAVKNKPGFFRVSQFDHELLMGVPGVQWSFEQRLLDDEQITVFDHAIVPRNVLPLIDDPQARRILNGFSLEPDWAARTARFEALGIKPRTTQHQAIDFIEQRPGILLADDMRVGKTLSCVGSHDPTTGPLVIVGPLSSRAVWLGWCKRVFPGVPIGVVTSRKFDDSVMSRPIVFGHYDVIHKWQSLRKIGTLVFDEAHALSNPDAKRTMAAGVLRMLAERVIAATGTPVWNRPAGMHAILGLIAPGQWGTYWDFADRYGAPVSTAWGKRYEGISRPEELHARLGEVMIRRRWIDVNKDIPPISRSVAVAEVSEIEQKRLDILAGKLKGERSNTAANLAAYRRQITGLKVSVTVDEARKIISRGYPVVVWTWHRDFAELIAQKLGTPFVIHGEIDADKREERMAAWKASPVPMPFVATMAVGQVAIDLSHAPFAIFAEIDYTPAILGQAEMRTFSPDRPMHITFVMANHIVDQRLVRALVSKLSSADPLGVAAARDSIDALREAVMGPEDHGDLDRLLEQLIASAA